MLVEVLRLDELGKGIAFQGIKLDTGCNQVKDHVTSHGCSGSSVSTRVHFLNDSFKDILLIEAGLGEHRYKLDHMLLAKVVKTVAEASDKAIVGIVVFPGLIHIHL